MQNVKAVGYNLSICLPLPSICEIAGAFYRWKY